LIMPRACFTSIGATTYNATDGTPLNAASNTAVPDAIHAASASRSAACAPVTTSTPSIPSFATARWSRVRDASFAAPTTPRACGRVRRTSRNALNSSGK
jgi:hypothetical protein